MNILHQAGSQEEPHLTAIDAETPDVAERMVAEDAAALEAIASVLS